MTASAPVAPPLPVAPHVRLRWRQRLGLPPDLVVDTAALAPADVETALTVAAAAVVDDPHLALALGLGCPTVTDRAAAAALGAVDGVHVVVGDRAAAAALAVDPVRAARLSHRGRSLVEAIDPRPRPGLGAGPAAVVAAALDELGTAPSAPVRARAAAALEGFAGVTGAAVVPSSRHPSIDGDAVVRLGGHDSMPSPSVAGAGVRRVMGRARRLAGRLLREARLRRR